MEKKDDHQPEPWAQDGTSILSTRGWTLAKTILPADARRIVAAVNDVEGIPTSVLESGYVRQMLLTGSPPEPRLKITDRAHPQPRGKRLVQDRRARDRRRRSRRSR